MKGWTTGAFLKSCHFNLIPGQRGGLWLAWLRLGWARLGLGLFKSGSSDPDPKDLNSYRFGSARSNLSRWITNERLTLLWPVDGGAGGRRRGRRGAAARTWTPATLQRSPDLPKTTERCGAPRQRWWTPPSHLARPHTATRSDRVVRLRRASDCALPAWLLHGRSGAGVTGCVRSREGEGGVSGARGWLTSPVVEEKRRRMVRTPASFSAAWGHDLLRVWGGKTRHGLGLYGRIYGNYSRKKRRGFDSDSNKSSGALFGQRLKTICWRHRWRQQVFSFSDFSPINP